VTRSSPSVLAFLIENLDIVTVEIFDRDPREVSGPREASAAAAGTAARPGSAGAVRRIARTPRHGRRA
jgi:hypothetical protein